MADGAGMRYGMEVLWSVDGKKLMGDVTEGWKGEEEEGWCFGI